MSENISVSDESRGEALPTIGDISFNYGVASPYPTETSTPVPSASFRVAGDIENLYRLGNTARIEAQQDTETSRKPVFTGRFSASSDLPVGSMSIDHISNQLNKEITAHMFVSNPEFDTSNGLKTIVGGLRTIYSECGVTEYGVRGDFWLNGTMDGVARPYYDHPIMRPVQGATDVDGLGIPLGMNWKFVGQTPSDEGLTFGIGEKFTILIKANNNFGKASEGEELPYRDTWHMQLTLGQSRRTSTDPEFPNARTFLNIEYEYETRSVTFTEGTINGSGLYTTVRSHVFNNDHAEWPGSLSWFVLEAERISSTTVAYNLFFYNRSEKTQVLNYVSDANIFSSTLALDSMVCTSVDMDYSSPDLGAREGVQALYVVRGHDWEIVEEDAFPVNLHWFDRPYLKDIVFPTMKGNGWQMVQDLCSTYGLSFDVLHNQYQEANLLNYGEPMPTTQGSQVSVQASTRELSERVEVVNYSYKYKPYFGSVAYALYKADQVWSVGKGETIETLIQLPEGSDFFEVIQPVCVHPNEVAKWWHRPIGDDGVSIYSVFDDDNISVDRKSWDNSGGSISFEPTENPGEIKMIIIGPNNDLLSKGETFHISAAGSDIPSLIIAGRGMIANKKTVSLRTGVRKADNLRPVGITYDNPLVCNEKIVYQVGAGLTSLYGTTKTEANGTFPAPEGTRFPLAPILKHGAYYSPTSISQKGSETVQVSGGVRYTPVPLMQDVWNNMTCGEYQAAWPANTICREVNISPLGKDSF